METAKVPPRAWRWDVWHDADRSWHAALTERNTRLLPLPLLLLQKAVPGTADDEGAASIPRIIHQIWLGPRAIPAACHEWMQTWKALHPSWEYRLWTDEDVKTLALRNQKAFDAAGNYGEKSDILRYEILAQHGGVYADVDVACLKSFDSLLEVELFSYPHGQHRQRGDQQQRAAVSAAAPDSSTTDRHDLSRVSADASRCKRDGAGRADEWRRDATRSSVVSASASISAARRDGHDRAHGPGTAHEDLHGGSGVGGWSQRHGGVSGARQ